MGDEMKKINIFLFLSCFAISFLILSFLFLYPRMYREKEVVLPNLLELEKKEAVRTLEELGLTVNIETKSSDRLENIVLEMIPKEKSVVKRKSNVFLVVSVQHNEMPNVLGMDYEMAIKKFEGYQIHTIDIVDNELPIGTIKKQAPGNGLEITKEVPIIFYKVIHDNYLVIPNMVGWEISKVSEYEKRNQIFFEYKFEYSIDFKEGIVLNQSALPNTRIVNNGLNHIILTISKSISELPDFTDYDIEVAIGVCRFLNIFYEVKLIDSSLPVNQIIAQELEVSNGYHLTFYVSE